MPEFWSIGVEGCCCSQRGDILHQLMPLLDLLPYALPLAVSNPSCLMPGEKCQVRASAIEISGAVRR